MEIYHELKIDASGELQDIIIAELSELDFESFTQEDAFILAYILQENYIEQKPLIDEIIARYGLPVPALQVMENNINWNARWEESFNPIEIPPAIRIRAPFHDPDPSYTYDILIQPKMSFGTGHHETTQLMLELMMEIDFRDAACLDMGCGTGVLAILANRLGAAFTIAIDYDEWCFENAAENFELNEITNATVVLGDASALSEQEFLDLWLPHNKRIILSNITRNYNLENLAQYHNITQPGSVMLLSGFYMNDLQDITNAALSYGIKFVKSKSKNNWCAALFIQQ